MHYYGQATSSLNGYANVYNVYMSQSNVVASCGTVTQWPPSIPMSTAASYIIAGTGSTTSQYVYADASVGWGQQMIGNQIGAQQMLGNQIRQLGNQQLGQWAMQAQAIPQRSPESVERAIQESIDRRRAWDEEQKKKQAMRDQAREKARKLLLEFLSEPEKERFSKEQCFELRTDKRTYRIKLGSRVEEIDPDTKKVRSAFCIHPPHYYHLPAEDVALSQKLLLEADEEGFRRIANETRIAA